MRLAASFRMIVMSLLRTVSITALALVASGLAEITSSSAGEVVRGPVRVCRKPMLAGSAAFTSLVNPGPDAWTKLAERQADEAKYCYVAGDIELQSSGCESASA
jgi:hypothetical protein